MGLTARHGLEFHPFLKNSKKILFEGAEYKEARFRLDSLARVVILPVGLPQLNNTLQLSIHEPLRQRIIMNYNIDGYSKEKGRAYIECIAIPI